MSQGFLVHRRADKARDEELQIIWVNATAEAHVQVSSAQGHAAAQSPGLGFQKNIIYRGCSFLNYQSFEFADSA